MSSFEEFRDRILSNPEARRGYEEAKAERDAREEEEMNKQAEETAKKELATYDEERSRGLVHTEAYSLKMERYRLTLEQS